MCLFENRILTALVAAIFAAGLPAVAEDAPPFRAADGLFDFTNTKTLGLAAISGEHIQIHEATEESGFRFAHHPGLIVFRDRLYCSWSNGRAHEDRPGQRVLYASSADGKTWSPSQVLATPPKDVYGSCVAAGFHVHNDTLVAYYTLTHEYPTHNLHNPKNAIFAKTSTDGRTWGKSRKIASGFFIEGPRLLPNGRLFLGGEYVGEKWKSNQARMQLLYSDSPDGVDGWKQTAINPASAEPTGLKVFGYTEPCPFVRKDRTIVCPFRNQSGFLYASESRDNGETWSVPRQTTFPDSMARFSTGRLPGGRIYLINNPGPGRMNRGLLTIALSDDGVLFNRAWIVRGEPTRQRFKGKGKRDGWQYPSSLVWKNSLFIAYSINKEDIAITRIPLESFNATAFPQDKPVRQFTGSENPTAQGWTEITDQTASAPGRLVGKAWRIEDDDNSGPEWRSYEVTLADDQRDRMRREGFTYRWRVRIPEETTKPTRAVGTEVAIGRKDGNAKLRFAIQMGRRGDELLAHFHTGPRGHVQSGIRVKNADGFHDWELAFDGQSQTVNLHVDGQLLMTERCEHEDQGPHLLFGSRATDIGISEWESAELFIGTPRRELIEPPSLPPFVKHVYISRQEGYHTYRAPALVVTKKGTILAFAHGRKESVHDLGDQDMILRRSMDHGRTWSPMKVLLNKGKSTVGTPAPIIDRETGRIVAVFHIDARRIYSMFSDDEGVTWSEPTEITHQVAKPTWKMIATAPGIGIQIRHGRHAGRLVVPAYYRLTEHKGSSPFAYVMYSDDLGQTWKYGESAGPETCEAQVAETKDGGLIINARNHWARTGGRPDLSGKRIVARSNDGGATWSKPTFDAALIEPTCQASLLRYSFDDESSRGRLLFANPADIPTSNHGGPRHRLTVRLSYDDGRTWPISRLVDQSVTAYSTLARLPDGRVGMMYESGAYRRLTFVAFDLKWLGEQ